MNRIDTPAADPETLAAELKTSISPRSPKEWSTTEQAACIAAFNAMRSAFPELIPNTVCLYLGVKLAVVKACQKAESSGVAHAPQQQETVSEHVVPARRGRPRKTVASNGDPLTAEKFYELLSGIKTNDPALQSLIGETQMKVWELIESNTAQLESNGEVHIEQEATPAPENNGVAAHVEVTPEAPVVSEPAIVNPPEVSAEQLEGERRARVLATIIASEGWHQRKISYPDAVVKFADTIILKRSRATDNIPHLRERLEAALNLYDPDTHGAPNQYCFGIIEQVRSEPDVQAAPKEKDKDIERLVGKQEKDKENDHDTVERLRKLYLSDAIRFGRHLFETSDRSNGIEWTYVQTKIYHAVMSLARHADEHTRQHFGAAMEQLIQGCVKEALRMHPDSLEFKISSEIDQSIEFLKDRVRVDSEKKENFLKVVCVGQFETFEEGVKWAAETAVRERLKDVQKWINNYPWFGYDQAVIHMANGAAQALWRYDPRLTHILIDQFIDDSIDRRMRYKSERSPSRLAWEQRNLRQS